MPRSLSKIFHSSKVYIFFRALALSLNISEDFFLGIHKSLLRGGGSFCKLRSLYYPAIADGGVRPGVTRCGEHSDYGSLTFLFQDSLGGLQIRGVGGRWLDAEPVEGSILVRVNNFRTVSGDEYEVCR